MSVKWIVDKHGVGRTRDGDEKQFPGYEVERLGKTRTDYIMNFKPMWDPNYWHSGHTTEDLSGFKKD